MATIERSDRSNAQNHRGIIFGFGVALALGVVIFVQQGRISALEADNLRLSNQLAALASAEKEPIPVPAQGNTDADELARLRAEHSELVRLRGEVTQLRTQMKELGARMASVTAQPEVTATESNAAPFAKITTNAIPGRYRCIDSDEHGNVTKEQVIQLNDNGTFVTFWRPDGQASASVAYKWLLHPQGLVLSWQNGLTLFHSVSGAGIYISTKPDKSQIRIEKLDQ